MGLPDTMPFGWGEVDQQQGKRLLGAFRHDCSTDLNA